MFFSDQFFSDQKMAYKLINVSMHTYIFIDNYFGADLCYHKRKFELSIAIEHI